MEERKGVLTKEGQKFFGQLLDDLYKAKNPMVEMVDGKMFTLLIGIIDDNLIDKIPDKWKDPLSPIVDAGIEKDWETAGNLAADFLNKNIDIPGIDEDSEGLLFGAVVNFLVTLVLYKAKKESQPPAPGQDPPDDED